jgi:hypothetical protein
MRIKISEIGRRFEFVIERIGFTQVMRVSKLANEIDGAHQYAIFTIASVGGGRYWKARELDSVGDADGVERFDFAYAIHHEQLRARARE